MLVLTRINSILNGPRTKGGTLLTSYITHSVEDGVGNSTPVAPVLTYFNWVLLFINPFPALTKDTTGKSD